MATIVGLDLRPRCAGALHFARWLAGASRGQAVEPLVGVHVLEQEHLLHVLRYHHLDEVRIAAREAAERSIRDEGAEGEIRQVEIVEALQAAEGLQDVATRLHAGGIVIGRAAPRAGHGIVRLGRVARRLVRVADVPVVVVPPDMRAPDFAGDGPVVALTNLTDQSVATCRFAEGLARRLGRALLLVHAVEVATETVPGYASAATLERIAADRRAEAERAIATWAEGCAVRADATEILLGNVVEEATALAERRRAALVVAGSRHGSTLERLLVASTASALAAAATRPVAIVPPPHPGSG